MANEGNEGARLIALTIGGITLGGWIILGAVEYSKERQKQQTIRECIAAGRLPVDCAEAVKR